MNVLPSYPILIRVIYLIPIRTWVERVEVVEKNPSHHVSHVNHAPPPLAAVVVAAPTVIVAPPANKHSNNTFSIITKCFIIIMFMVTKTRRKRSAAKRVKNNTRSNKHRRGRRRGRTTKRGGMPHASRIGARAAAAVASPLLRNGPHYNVIYGRNPQPSEGKLVVEGIRYFGLPTNIPSPSIKEQAYKEYKEKTNPVELLSAADSVFSAAHKAEYNDERRKLFANQTPARPYIRNPVFYTTPIKPGNPYNDPTGKTIPQPTFSSPVGPSSELSSPPPPNSLSVQGTSKPITASPSFMRDLAPTSHKTNPGDIVKTLEFEGEEEVDNPNKYETPNSSPYKASNKSTQKGFNKNRIISGDIKSSPPPRFRF